MTAGPEDQAQTPCQRQEASQFDFWLGSWEGVWGDDKRCRNKVRRILGGCVILEEFDGHPGTELQGMSVSTYSAQEEKWKQTWVDNSGNYLDFVGVMEGERMVLRRRAVVDGAEIEQRMVWYEIDPRAFEWSWDRSDDGGQTWMTLWHLSYERIPD